MIVKPGNDPRLRTMTMAGVDERPDRGAPLVPACGARTRTGGQCRVPPMANGRCRDHGGLSTGPRTAEGLARMRRAKTRHGLYAEEVLAFRRAVRTVRSAARELSSGAAENSAPES